MNPNIIEMEFLYYKYDLRSLSRSSFIQTSPFVDLNKIISSKHYIDA